jgi:hypothetical protein
VAKKTYEGGGGVEYVSWEITFFDRYNMESFVLDVQGDFDNEEDAINQLVKDYDIYIDENNYGQMYWNGNPIDVSDAKRVTEYRKFDEGGAVDENNYRISISENDKYIGEYPNPIATLNEAKTLFVQLENQYKRPKYLISVYKRPTSSSGLEKLNVDEWYDYTEKFGQGGDVPNEDKMFQLPLEMVVYVPSTQDVDKVISVDEMDKRVDEVKQYLASKFGGYSANDKLGGFVDSTGKLVNEDVVQVTAFSTKEAYQEHKDELIKQLSIWGKKWGQEAIGFEFEGDLMYVPQDIYASGGLINDVFDVKDLKKYLVYKKAGFSYHYIFDIWKYEINEFNDQKGWALNTYKKYKDEWHLIESYGYEGLTLRECKEMIVMELRS